MVDVAAACVVVVAVDGSVVDVGATVVDGGAVVDSGTWVPTGESVVDGAVVVVGVVVSVDTGAHAADTATAKTTATANRYTLPPHSQDALGWLRSPIHHAAPHEPRLSGIAPTTPPNEPLTPEITRP